MKIASFIATVGYVGFLPKAPGTWGTIAAIPLIFLPSEVVFIIGILAFFMGWVATYCVLKNQTIPDKDPSYIVMDEFAAMALFFGGAGVCDGIDPNYWWQHSLLIVSAFALFRFFDILKPWPISAIDKSFKNKNNFLAALGVMLDDLFAVIFALPLYYALSLGVVFYTEKTQPFAGHDEHDFTFDLGKRRS